MPKVALYNQNGSTAGDIELNASVWTNKIQRSLKRIMRMFCD